MRGIRLERLDRVNLPPRPILQRLFAYSVLAPNYTFLPGVDIVFEGDFDPASGPVIVAVNHTDRYSYFPLAYKWWRDFDRFFAAWAKGKYFENPVLAKIIEKLGAIPTVSRGYIVARDFLATMGRQASDAEYRGLRDWVDRTGAGASEEKPAIPVPEKMLTDRRDILGRIFDPGRETYAQAVNALFTEMMVRFVEIHRRSFGVGRDLMIFPEGTRSARLAVGRPGIAQLALYFKKPVVPIGGNGADLIYPGACPLAKRGRVVYRIGDPITYEDLKPFHIDSDFIPFTPAAEAEHKDAFRGATDFIMARLNGLLDPRYRSDPEAGSGAEEGVKRFL